MDGRSGSAPAERTRPGPDVVDPADVRLLALLAQGLPVETIGRQTGHSERTVRRHLRRVCDAVGVDTTIEAVVWAVRQGLV